MKVVNYIEKDYNNRRELFKKYYHWGLKTQDCDPAMFMMNYVNKRMELNIEQRFWWAWLYGNTYNVATAWIIFNEFPDFENVDINRLTDWNTNNYKRLRYEIDNKWQKGFLPSMFNSYREQILSRGKTQLEYFQSLCTGDEVYNFYTLQGEIVKHWYKFGRYLSWFYLQTLKETCGLDLEPQDLLLSEQSSDSHKKGLIFAIALEEILDEESEINYKSKEVLAVLDEEAEKLMAELKSEYTDVKFDYFTMETALCAYKKFFRDKHSRYLGYYLDRQAENISLCQGDGWHGIDWQLLWDARNECLDKDLIKNKSVDKSRFGELLRNGTMKLINQFS